MCKGADAGWHGLAQAGVTQVASSRRLALIEPV
jgi:hypothetical protein